MRDIVWIFRAGRLLFCFRKRVDKAPFSVFFFDRSGSSSWSLELVSCPGVCTPRPACCSRCSSVFFLKSPLDRKEKRSGCSVLFLSFFLLSSEKSSLFVLRFQVHVDLFSPSSHQLRERARRESRSSSTGLSYEEAEIDKRLAGEHVSPSLLCLFFPFFFLLAFLALTSSILFTRA